MTAPGPATGCTTGYADVVALGESMVTFLPSCPGSLADVPSFERAIGGAESNVACCLAASGHTAKWISRVGADGFGDHLVAAIAAYGVDTTAVQRDPRRPTGIYFRTAGERATGRAPAHAGAAAGGASAVPAGGGTSAAPAAGADGFAEVAYYRAGSAASAMSPRAMPYRDLWSGRILHLSGITAALSDDCLALMRELTTRRPGRPLVSFDVNHRAGLWRGAEGPRALLDLARGADIVFVGEDEAEAAWGLTDGQAIRAALPEPQVLVVKQGAGGATAYTCGAGDAPAPGGLPLADARAGGSARAPGGDTVTFVPAVDVDVVASVGAGDAFAAGFLSATLRGLPPELRLRHGHLMAAAALTVPGDLGTPPSRAHADRLAELDGPAWETLHLGPGWTAAGAGEDQVEVRTV